MIRVRFGLIILFLFCWCASIAQDLYTARGYWEESNKDSYKKISEKKQRSELLTDNEQLYLADYENYLLTYYQRMPKEEQKKFELMKSTWDQELTQSKDAPKQPPLNSDKQEFTWRSKDHFHNGLYGLYYGITLVAITKPSNSLSGGLPLITAGLWQLGPVLNPKKYEGIDPTTMRAAGAGKFLGLGYGLALGFAIAGNSSDNENLTLGLSTLGSIGLGEVAFQIQKRKKYSEGYVELMRHYGFLGPAVGLLTVVAAENDNANVAGASVLVGGIGGLYLGSRAARKYDYTIGDVYAIRSLTWIYTGIGFALGGQLAEGGDRNRELFLLPAVTAVAGTIFGQRMVKGINLTPRQGGVLNLASGGAALIGLGLVTSFKTESVGVLIGVPSVFALITHQLIFHNYKMKNLQKKNQLGSNSKYPSYFSFQVNPENYFVNLKQNPERLVMTDGRPVMSNPIVKLNFTF
ncbi:MAG: hypothetical protein HY015_05920 [Bacteroidetes bacterium]|nr:hypothetical protein [Bacteroidota bacterium]MBI3482499.1 hypothetical protein [Bacteroidota bacterium]